MVRELCEARDNCSSQFFERSDILRMIDMLCTCTIDVLIDFVILYCYFVCVC